MLFVLSILRNEVGYTILQGSDLEEETDEAGHAPFKLQFIKFKETNSYLKMQALMN